jgi:hypothetical protein
MVEFFHKETHTVHPELGEIYTTYPIWWKKGYVQFENEWKQFFNPSTYNWITFRPIHLHFEVTRYKWRYFEFELVVLGLGIYIHHSLNTDEESEALSQETDDLLEEMKSRCICKECGEVFNADTE